MSSFADLPSGPLSDRSGLDRGTPLDRVYIEAFLDQRKHLIHGSVLEVEDGTYTARFGVERVSKSTIVDVDGTNPRATLIADLTQPGALPPDTFDCIILTQTLHRLRQPGLCVENCYRALRSAGVLLVTAPSLSRVSPTIPMPTILALHARRHRRVVLPPLER